MCLFTKLYREGSDDTRKNWRHLRKTAHSVSRHKKMEYTSTMKTNVNHLNRYPICIFVER